MKGFKRSYVLVLVSCVAMFMACQRFIRGEDEVNKAIAEAQVHLDVVKDLKAKELYPADFQQAEGNLNEAIQLGKHNRDQAYLKALESAKASKQILTKMVVGPIREEAITIKKEIEEKGPDTSLRDLLPKLDEILNYADELERGQQAITLSKFIEIRDKTGKAIETLKRNVVEQVESDISFGKGKYKISDLSEEGKQRIEDVVRKIILAREDYLKQFPDYKQAEMIIKVNTYGYTDELPFNEGTRLVKELEEYGVTSVPSSPRDERRKALNKNLSQLRAETIGTYLKERISELEDHSLNVEIKPEFIGRGETVPEDVPPPYPTDDKRRRMCKIDSYIDSADIR